jgi:hypothetical protein
VTIARRPRGAGRPHCMQEPQRAKSSGSCRSSEPNHQAQKTNSPSEPDAHRTACRRPYGTLRARALPNAG